jgi:palmitoyl-protein thioesterase
MVYKIVSKVFCFIFSFVSVTGIPLPFALTAPAKPIALLHGISSNAANMQNLASWIETTFQRPVFNLEIGNGVKTSLYTPMPSQLQELCATIYALPALQNGFDFIGMSQGGLLARGYVERCNVYPVRNLITLVSPHGGTILKNSEIKMYSEFYQNHFSASNYWRDPRVLEEYLTMCIYLPILNNEIMQDDDDDAPTNIADKNEYIMTYYADDYDEYADDEDYADDNDLADQQRKQIKTLDNFVLVWSPKDEIIQPPESAKFSFYNAEFTIVPLEETDIYASDALGLKYLNEKQRLHFYATNCTHSQHRDPICFNQLYPIFAKYLF